MKIENDTLIFERGDFDIPITEELIEDARRGMYRRGHWGECWHDDRVYSGICSVCGEASLRHVREKPLRYCPQCGAKMDEEGNE